MPSISGVTSQQVAANQQQLQLLCINQGYGMRDAIPFKPQTANITQSSLCYDSPHLLGLPKEVRDRIYRFITLDTTHQPRPFLGQPTCAYKSLGQVCRQLYHEVSQALPLFIVPHNQIETLTNKPLARNSSWEGFKSLYIQLRHDNDTDIYGRLSYALTELAPYLQDLRIYGVGKDGFGVPTSSQRPACGKFDNSLMPHAGNLSIAGQAWRFKLPLLQTFLRLFNLRTMVLDNLNVPLLKAHVLKNKPYLEKLIISTDHRTTIHNAYQTAPLVQNMIGSLATQPNQSYQLRELTVAFNGLLHVGSTVSMTVKSLESLTLIVPDQSRQTPSQPQLSWALQLAKIISILPDGENLQELRICFHKPIHENAYDLATLINSFKTYVPNLDSLKSLEVHFDIQSPWAPQEFFDALPMNLERFYIYEHFALGDYPAVESMIGYKTSIATVNYFFRHGTLVGEDMSRTDAITFSGNQLSFVGYEYKVQQQQLAQELQADEIMCLVKINGRLLDRLRNNHLAKWNGGHIPWRAREDCMDHAPQAAGLLAKASQLDAPMFDEIPEQHVFATEHEYFGNEGEAEKVFHREVAVPIDALPPVTYPVVVDVPDKCEHSNHWIRA